MKEERLINILKYLEERADKPVTANELSDELQVSVKTIHNDLLDLKNILDTNVVELNAQRGLGYYLEIKDIESFHKNLLLVEKENSKRNEHDFNNTNVRIQYLLEHLLFQKSYVRSDSFSRSIGLSRSQFTNDCSIVRDFIKPFNLKLVSRPHYGIRIEGSEFNRRLCIASAYLQRMNGYNENTLFPAVAEYQELERINKTILKIFKQFNYQVSDVIKQNLIIHLFIALKRVNIGQEIHLDDTILEKLKNTEEYKISIYIVCELSKLFQISFPESEIGYITMHLNGKRTYRQESDTKPLIDKKIDLLVTKMLAKVYENYGIDLQKDVELRLVLGLHLVPLLRRIEFGLILKNPLKEEIKTKITMAYEVAICALMVISEAYSKYLNEDEIGYFALHFNLAIERVNVDKSKKNVLIVCSTGQGSAQLLKVNFLRHYASQVNIVNTIQASDLDGYDTSYYDLILSTIPLANDYSIPVIHVQTFLEEESLNDIQIALDKCTFRMEDYFNEKLFFSDLNIDSKEEILKYMCNQIKKVKEVNDGFYEAVMRRESVATTSFGNLVAIPHPDQLMSKETFVAVSVLKKPILWDGKKVQLIFLVSIESKKVHDIQGFYQRVSRLLISRNKVRNLIKEKNYKYLIQVLKEK